MKGNNKGLLRKHVWCSQCAIDRPPKIRKADFLVPARQKHYDLVDGEIDKRFVGVCSQCLEKLSDFKRMYAKPIDKDSIPIAYKDELD